jgi:hypothetical protein
VFYAEVLYIEIVGTKVIEIVGTEVIEIKAA